MQAAVASGEAIAVPMYASPSTAASTSSGVKPDDKIITENCGTAFLYPSANGDDVHYDYGFFNAPNGNVYVTAHVGVQNPSEGIADSTPWVGADIGSSFETQGNLYSGRGQVEVSAYIHSTGILYDCTSSPDLHEEIPVY